MPARDLGNRPCLHRTLSTNQSQVGRSAFPTCGGAPEPGLDSCLEPVPSVVELDEPTRRKLSRSGLLLPLLRSEVASRVLDQVILSEEESQAALQAWCQRQGIANDESLARHCQTQGMSIDDVRWQAELPVKIDQHSLAQYGHRAEQRFLERKSGLDRVVYSLIRVEDPGLAQELYLRVSEGEASFADLATTHSQGHEKTTRGVVGPAPLSQAHPTLVELLRSGSAGQIFPPLRIENWWLVVRLEELIPACFDDAMKSLMSRELFEAWLNEEVTKEIQRYQPASVS